MNETSREKNIFSKIIVELSEKSSREIDCYLDFYGLSDIYIFKDTLNEVIESYFKSDGEIKNHTHSHVVFSVVSLFSAIKLSKMFELSDDIVRKGHGPVVAYIPSMEFFLSLKSKTWSSICGSMLNSEKKHVLDSFNSGLIKKVAISDSSCTGINLYGPKDYPCKNVFRAGLSLDQAVNMQAIMRFRNGTVFHDLVADHPHDEAIYEVCNKKMNWLDDLGESVAC